MAWRDTVAAALHQLGGRASLNEIYDVVEQIREQPLPASWRAVVRRELENNSADSQNFHRALRPILQRGWNRFRAMGA